MASDNFLVDFGVDDGAHLTQGREDEHCMRVQRHNDKVID